jgi:hypothetical protein
MASDGKEGAQINNNLPLTFPEELDGAEGVAYRQPFADEVMPTCRADGRAEAQRDRTTIGMKCNGIQFSDDHAEQHARGRTRGETARLPYTDVGQGCRHRQFTVKRLKKPPFISAIVSVNYRRCWTSWVRDALVSRVAR